MHAHGLVAVAVGLDRARQRRQRDAVVALRAVAGGGQCRGALGDVFGEARRLDHFIDQFPVPGALAAHALGGGAEDIGMVAPDLALVGHPGQAAGAGQYAQQRHLGQADRGRTVVDQHDLVAGKRQLIAAAGGGAVAGGDELQPGVLAGILDGIAGLVGELAEVDLPRVRRLAQHEDVGAGAEDPLARAGQHHGAHLGMLEADALQRVVQFDIDAEVVRIQLERVAGPQAGFLVDVHRQRGDGAIETELPVAVLVGMALERDGGGGFCLGGRLKWGGCRRGHGCLLDAL
ncbi:hypothetical protein D9M69_340240 [compost metagenome]